MVGVLPLSIIGFSILRFSSNVSAKYAAVFLNAIACFGASSGFLSWGINNAGSPAVAAVAGGYMVMVGSVGGVVSTYVLLQMRLSILKMLTCLPLDGHTYLMTRHCFSTVTLSTSLSSCFALS